MTRSVGVREAKTHLSRLLQEVSAGEKVVITPRGREVARLVPPRREREFGLDRGRFVVPDDVDAPLSDVHRDLFDRLLVAQARQLGLTLVTAGPLVASYDVEILAVG